ncbi:MAG TPA: tripartite tricarboxylate transporter TctB family protein [Burkholderiales bacterium]|nr:tripartite tricarboxylate transporter TctB family protein [Burkholderiales bacterium]
MIRKDGVAGLAVAVASLGLFWRTFGLEKSSLVPVGPAFYPRIVLAITALLGIALLVSDLLRKERPAPAAGGARPNYRLVALSFGVFAVYVAALPLAGFRIATFAFAAVLNLVLQPPRSAAHWGRALVFGAITALACYYAFEHYLQVLLPRGSWTGL